MILEKQIIHFTFTLIILLLLGSYHVYLGKANCIYVIKEKGLGAF